MAKLLDTPIGVATAHRAACHEIARRMGRKFHRNIVIAFEEWRNTGTFNLSTMVADLNEEHTQELIDYFTLMTEEECIPDAPEPPVVYYPFIAYGTSEGESFTTSATFVEKLRVDFTATLGVKYRIDYTFENYKVADEDVRSRVQINDTNTICESDWKNQPYADRWNTGTGGFYLSDTLSGATHVDIDWRNKYGTGDAGIRRARILVTRVDPAPP